MIKKLFYFISFLILFPPFLLSQNKEIIGDISYKIRSSFIYNFIKSCEWQNENELKEYVIALKSNNKKIKKYLEELSQSKTIKNKPIKIVEYDEALYTKIQILYVDKSEFKSFKVDLKNKQFLMISDFETNFYETDIAFVDQNNNIKFILNEKYLKISKLKLDSKIYTMAYKTILLNENKIDRNLQSEWTKLVESELWKKLKSNEKVTLSNEESKIIVNKFNEQNDLINKKSRTLDSIDNELNIKKLEITEQNKILYDFKEKIHEQKKIYDNELSFKT